MARNLELRYGLGNEHPRTLDEIAHTFNLTGDRVRHIERGSLHKLQNRSEARKLRDDVKIFVDRGRPSTLALHVAELVLGRKLDSGSRMPSCRPW